jgi:hypothetical protein
LTASVKLTSDERKAKEAEILMYAKESVKQWKADPTHNYELPMFSLFMQLNDGESDLLASYDEIEPMMNFIHPLKDE